MRTAARGCQLHVSVLISKLWIVYIVVCVLSHVDKCCAVVLIKS